MCNFLDQAEIAARDTIKVWIKQVLRESFLQALRKSWTLQSATATNQNQTNLRDYLSSSSSEEDDDNHNDPEYQVELSMAGVNACFLLVERVSKAWQTQLRQEQHERVAEWVMEVYQQGKSTLWVTLTDDNDNNNNNSSSSSSSSSSREGDTVQQQQQQQQPHSNENKEDSTTSTSNAEIAEETQQSLSIGDDDAINNDNNDEDDLSSTNTNTNTNTNHPWVYNKLRSLGRKTELDSTSLSVPDALNEIKDFTSKHPTYWPLDNNVIDQESIKMSQRMRARDRHGAGGGGSSSGGGGRNGSSYTKKTVKFKVVPKSFTSLPTTTQEDSQQKSTIVETLLLARKKKNSTDLSFQPSRKRTRMVEHKEIPRVPFDFLTTSNGNPAIELSIDEKKELNKLLVLNNNNNNNNNEDDDDDDDEGNNNNNSSSETTGETIPTTSTTKPEITLGLFGGLQDVGQTSHFLQNPSENVLFMASRDDSNTGNNNKIIRRKQKVSIQERLDPNRLQQRSDIGTPKKSKSKFLRTENWFDNQKKYFDLDLGWCLLEITIDDDEKGGGNNQKRLCAFSSMEICLDDND